VANTLPARPNLDHLKSQAKTLIASLKDGDTAAVRSFIKWLPAAAKLSPAKARAAGFRLADAQSVIARQHGFDSWPALARHVGHLRLLEGEWHFMTLQVDGQDMPKAAIVSSKLLIDGDRFRMESAEANYEGVLTIDVDAEPARIDIEFVEGPEAGNSSYGIYELNGDQLTICLGLVGSSRPAAFTTKKGSGHALEKLRRASATRPTNVLGGKRRAESANHQVTQSPNHESFDVPMTPLMKKLEGEWLPVKLITNGEEMRADWLAFGSRTMRGNEMKVVFGGQTMVHAKVRIDESAAPMAVDYLNLSGGAKGKVTFGIMDWVGNEARFLMAGLGEPRPASFAAPGKAQTLSQWRRKS
jgi:uncharacterized protein (TIGR03067 family)